ncbi:hypothetical protein LYSBPC_22180 [Lysinibacillus piscis]|uniref:Uncharacterized protein n=1 Tax=Lysinibacillus piscis TaxID=2518931 RepID=A0ABQ5NLX1_9BACI|nr:hypothetical protein LYSBPC_22180 [Lysinibacillus sp. KH24]
MLDLVQNTIHDAPSRTKTSMNNFLYTVGISYVPLHDKATAKAIGPVEMERANKKPSILYAYEMIQKMWKKGELVLNVNIYDVKKVAAY